MCSIRSNIGHYGNLNKLFCWLSKPAVINLSHKALPNLRSAASVPGTPVFSHMQTRQLTILGTIEHTAINDSTASAFKNFSAAYDGSKTEMIDLWVGPQSQHFRVHKKLLCRRIPFFNNAAENSMEFPDERPESFYALLLWVYTEKLPVKLDAPQLMSYVTHQWVSQEREKSATILPNFDLLDEIYTTLPAELRPQDYISWMFWSMSRQKSENLRSTAEEVQKLITKHADMKADLVKYLAEEKAWYEMKQSYVAEAQRIKEAEIQAGEYKEKEENDNGIDHVACTEAFVG